MEKNRTNPEKNESTKFAFLPEMVLEHLNHSEPTKLKVIPNEETSSVTLSQNIIFDPLADPFEGINIEIEPSKKKAKKIKKAKIKYTETVTVPKLEIITNTTSEHKIIQFVKKIKFNFLNF
jgi:flagellar basal body P-ring protein FlgI